MDCKHIPLNHWSYIKSGPYRIFVADTPCKKIQGLQGITRLPQNSFMIFKNIPPGLLFHTRNCLFPLDIVPINKAGKVLNIYTVGIDVEEIGPMPVDTNKVLEAPAFWFKRNGIEIGNYIPLLNV